MEDNTKSVSEMARQEETEETQAEAGNLENVKTLELSPDMKASVEAMLADDKLSEEEKQKAMAKLFTDAQPTPLTVDERLHALEKATEFLSKHIQQNLDVLAAICSSVAQIGLKHSYISIPNQPAPDTKNVSIEEAEAHLHAMEEKVAANREAIEKAKVERENVKAAEGTDTAIPQEKDGQDNLSMVK